MNDNFFIGAALVALGAWLYIMAEIFVNSLLKNSWVSFGSKLFGMGLDSIGDTLRISSAAVSACGVILVIRNIPASSPHPYPPYPPYDYRQRSWTASKSR